GWVSGGAFILASPPLLRIIPVHWQGRLTVAAVFLFGILLIVNVTNAPDHVLLGDSVRSSARSASVAHSIHRVTSLLLMLHYIGGPVILALWWHGVWRRAAVTISLVEALAGCAIAVLFLVDSREFIGLMARV